MSCHLTCRTFDETISSRMQGKFNEANTCIYAVPINGPTFTVAVKAQQKTPRHMIRRY
jgi:hypothetical protein